MLARVCWNKYFIWNGWILLFLLSIPFRGLYYLCKKEMSVNENIGKSKSPFVFKPVTNDVPDLKVQVIVPKGMYPGMPFYVKTAKGIVMVTLPSNITPGSSFTLNIPVQNFETNTSADKCQCES